MTLKEIFVNRHAEMRSGWRAALCVLLTLSILYLLQVALESLRATADVLGPVILLTSTLLGSFIMTRFINRKPFSAIGLSLHPAMGREFGLGCALGIAMIASVFLVEYVLGYAEFSWRDLSAGQAIGVFAYSAVFFALAALGEEVLFRGYIFQTLVQGITFLPATLTMALFFALAHTINPNVSTFGLVNVALAAIWLSIAYMKTRSLWLPFGLHFAWNFFQTSVFSFPTSGIDFITHRLGTTVQSGPEWI
ncbi:MAG: lysostaphin resistance A-like protein, partial [Terriglobia bacterium]